MYGRKTARKLVREHVYYVAVRTLGRPYALTKYAEKKLSSSCAENVLPSSRLLCFSWKTFLPIS